MKIQKTVKDFANIFDDDDHHLGHISKNREGYFDLVSNGRPLSAKQLLFLANALSEINKHGSLDYI